MLITCTFPRKINLSSNTHQTEHVHVTTDSVCIRWSLVRHRKKGSNSLFTQNPFYTRQRINPLGSKVSITSMLCCIYKLILLLWV
ncbi:unnamed protein product [Staurois parvus]|uniref:Uncharacterized protein n=1 Tax=Staurois parvus TaxID=386267 RepID=A0ABN9FBB5_9NEOB|nr:unnamed protein product [Staurois parvus]